MVEIIRTNAKHQGFRELVELLDADLAERDGKEHAFYNQFNSIEIIKHAVILYKNKELLGCGAFKEYDAYSVEIKRMYTLQKSRGKGIATKILNELENWATELGYQRCVLETGKRQHEAIQLYQKNGYMIIPNYQPYCDVENSVCFKKKIG
ncbi:MAG TPA: GNAT family N-acetyltransferase [Flavobacteriia bacterium]|nr:GNAT family N-acetyltransferase [Flavobacteriia bacterium]